MTEHLNDADIADYLDDPDGFDRRAEIEAHLADCAPCRETLGVAQRFDAEMDAVLMRDFMAAAGQRPTTPSSLVALARRIDDEEREATEYIRTIVMSPRAFTRAALSERQVLHTVGVVRVLCEAARKLREQNPKHSLTVADEAGIHRRNAVVAALRRNHARGNARRGPARACQCASLSRPLQ